jgi:nitrogen-specific signal transduction histidine kinase
LIFSLVPLILIIAYRRGARRRESARRLEEALESQRELAQSRDDFIADLSHELRTPLTGIYGFALALGDNSDLSEENHELVTHIVSDAAELTRMVDDLITTGRIAAGTLAMSTEDLRLKPAMTEAAEIFAMRGIAVQVRMPDVVIRADRLGMRQLLINLVSNAARHGGDEIAIEGVSATMSSPTRLSTTVPVCRKTSSHTSSTATCTAAVARFSAEVSDSAPLSPSPTRSPSPGPSNTFASMTTPSSKSASRQ